MPEDIKVKEEKKKEEEQKEKKKESWFDRIPTLYYILAIGLLFFKYQSIVNKGGNIQELWVWVLVILVILFLMGREGLKRVSVILTPKEARAALDKEIESMRMEGRIPRWAKVYVGPNMVLFHHEGMPQHYQVGVELMSDAGREYKRGIVFAEGNTKEYAVVQDSPGKLTGREPIPVMTPKIFKKLKQYEIGMDQFIFGSDKR